jgi:cell wall-associated NlpC family hydrolase
MAFASRRTCIEPKHVTMILKDDGYSTVEMPADVMPGDLVVYETDPGDISHVAVVVSNESDLRDGSSRIVVISQWGADGEYLHDHRDVHPLLGQPTRFYTDRRKG